MAAAGQDVDPAEEVYASIDAYGAAQQPFGRSNKAMRSLKLKARRQQGSASSVFPTANEPVAPGGGASRGSRGLQNALRALEEKLVLRDVTVLVQPAASVEILQEVQRIKALQSITAAEEQRLVAAIERILARINALLQACAPITPVRTGNEKRPTNKDYANMKHDIENFATVVLDVDVAHCFGVQDALERIDEELKEVLPQPARLTRYLERAVELYSGFRLETSSREDAENLIKGTFDVAERLDRARFLEIFRSLLHALAIIGDTEVNVMFAGSIFEHALTTSHWQDAMQVLTENSDFLNLMGNLNVRASLQRMMLERDTDSIITKIVNYFNYSVVAKVSPCEPTVMLCRLVDIAFGNSKLKLDKLLSGIQFEMQASRSVQHVLFVTFMGADKAAVLPSSPLAARDFISSLVRTKQLPHFNNRETAKGCHERILHFFQGLVLNTNSATMWREVIDGKPPAEFPMHMLLSTPFVLFCSMATASRRPVTFLKVLMYAGSQANIQEQVQMMEKRANVSKAVDDMFEQLEAVFQYFDDVSVADTSRHTEDSQIHRIMRTRDVVASAAAGVPKTYSQVLYDVIAGKLVQLAATTTGSTFENIIRSVHKTAAHFLNMAKDEIVVILAAGKLDKYADGMEALKDTIDGVTRGLPSQWNTVEISNRLFYLYCYARYRLEDFRKWFEDLNFSIEGSGGKHFHTLKPKDVEAIFRDFEKQRDALDGRADVERLGFKCLQHNQVTAILGAVKQTEQATPRHVFIKVGTGQGKSLIIALLALRYALKGHRVQIFTCYKHLAARDFGSFEKVFDEHDLKPCLIKDTSSEFPKHCKIVYSDMMTYYNCLQRHAHDMAHGDAVDVDKFAGYFEPCDKDVCILDEFDSLIIDHDAVSSYVFDYSDVLNVAGMTDKELADETAFTDAVLERNVEIGAFYRQQMQTYGLYPCVSKVLNGDGARSAGRDGRDALGKKVTYIGGFVHELQKRSVFHSRAVKLDTLAHLRTFKHVIGLSGSIKPKEIQRFRSVFQQEVCFIDIPPFYGPTNPQNKTISDLRGPAGGVSSMAEWLRLMKEDIGKALANHRPVLVFANRENAAEWDGAKALCEQFRRDSLLRANDQPVRFQVIDDEADVNKTNLEAATMARTITLSTHVAGRGADFVVQPEINRRGGLHVLIAFEPSVKSRSSDDQDKFLDRRMEIQMCGRTARMDRSGSHSIITNTRLAEEEGQDITVKPFKESLYHLGMEVIRRLSRDSSHRAGKMWKRWIWTMFLFDKLEAMPAKIENVPVKRGKVIESVRSTQEQKVAIVLNELLDATGKYTDPKRSGCVIQ